MKSNSCLICSSPKCSSNSSDEFDEHLGELQIKHELLFNDVDRLDAEASLRFALVAPLVTLFVVCAALTSCLWLLGLLVPAALLRQALVLKNETRAKVLQAVMLGRVTSGSIAYIKLKTEGW